MTKDPMHTLESAQAWTRKMTYGHYENFPVASWLVPKNLRQDVCNVYAFSRVADDFADEAEFEGQRMERLQEWRNMLVVAAARAANLPTDEMRVLHPVFIALAETLRTRHLSVQLCNDLITAFMLDVKKTRYANFVETLHYCRHSANPVGRLILQLFGYGNEQWMTWSDHICTALQLANFWQDVAVDLKKDRIYLQADDMARCGVTEAMLCARELTDGVRELMKFQVDRTRSLFLQGRALCDTVPHRRLQLELRLTWLGGMRILERIAQNNYNPYIRPKLGLRDGAIILWRALRWRR